MLGNQVRDQLKVRESQSQSIPSSINIDQKFSPHDEQRTAFLDAKKSITLICKTII